MSDEEEPDDVRQARMELVEALGQRYLIEDVLGKGGAGIAFKATHKASNSPRVAKVLKPEVRTLTDLAAEFRREATILARLRHPNLVAVFEQSQADEVPYFVMDYVQGSPLVSAMPALVREFPRGLWIAELRKILQQLTDALAYLHAQVPPLLHLDIKPDNVVVTRNYRRRPVAVLLDFGISRFKGADSGDDLQTEVRGTFRMWPQKYLDALKRMTTPGRTVFVIDREKLSPQLDLHLLGRTLALAMDAGCQAEPERALWSESEVSDLRYLEHIARRLNIDEQTKNRPFASAGELFSSLRRLELEASRARHYFDEGQLKLPGATLRNFGLRARALTDWPPFQRLRGIKQLGLTHLVYPGAVHTRFEHSLGVFENAIDMLDSIVGPSGDYRFRSIVSDEELVATTLVALFHDIGHYPFAHQFRVSGVFPPHEALTLQIMEDGEFEGKICSVFNADVYAAMIKLMRYVDHYEHPGDATADMDYPGHLKVLRGVVAGPIDADKLDYVTRDSLHAGVPYGNGIDRDRFLRALRVWWNADGKAELLLSDKGRVGAEALVFARYLMTSEVYWNHAVRSYAAMLSAAVSQFTPEEARSRLHCTDEQFLAWLESEPRSRWFTELLACRQPYRRVFVHQQLGGSGTSGDSDRKLFTLLEKAATDDPELRRRLMETIASALKLSVKEEHHMVLDVPAGMTRISGVRVLAEGHDEPGAPGPIFAAIGDNFDGFARKARVFVHPSLIAKRPIAEASAIVRRELTDKLLLD